MRYRLLLFLVFILPAWPSLSTASEVPYAKAAQTIIAETQEKGCARPDSTLAKVLCLGTLRLGVRTNYLLFSEAAGKEFKGFEVDLAKLLAKRLSTSSYPIITPRPQR
jgi:ABC-type amino acid transport substrate-binding protein